MAHPHLNPPLAGREETLAAVVDGLRDSRHGGVVLLAPAGLGKTALLRTVARLPLDDLQFFEVPARPAAAAPVPFGALAPFLGGLPEGSEDSSVEVIRTVARFVAQKSKGRRPVLVIDDADGLDSASAAAIAQLAVNGTVRLLMSSRPGTAANADVGALVSEGMLAPLRIEPLDFAQGHELCQSVLGAPVLPGSSRMLVAAAGGNPQTLVLLLAECRRLGRLVRRNDIWLLVDELPRQCRPLADLATAELMRLSEGERTAVLTLGLAGPARVRTLAPLVGTGLLERLEARGLARTVAVADQPDAWVRLTPALHEEAVRQLAPLSLKRKVHSWLRALRQDGGLAPEQQVLAVRWALECGETPSPRELLAAARIANAAYQPGTAAFAAAACRTSGSRHPAAVQLARAALCRGQFHTAAAAAGSAIESARDPMVLQEAVLAARQVAMHQGGGEAELEALADRWEAALERIARHWKADPGHREGVRLLRAEARQLGGHFAASGRELEELAQHGSTGQVRALAVMLLAERQSALGLAAAGAALAERALAAARTAGRTGIRPEQLLARCVLVLIRSGQLARAAEVLEDLDRRPAAMLVFGGTAEFLRGLIDFKRGAADRALARLAAAVEGLRQSDPEQLLPRALAYAAAAASGADDRQAAGRFAAEFAGLKHPGPPEASLLAQAHVAAARAPFDGTSVCLDRLADIARMLSAAGMPAAELEVRAIMFRLGDRGRLQDMIGCAASCDGPEAAAYLACTKALQSRDAAQALRGAELAAEAGYLLLAAEAASHSARFFARDGNQRMARQAGRLLQGMLKDLPAAATAQLAGTPSRRDLTFRERDVAVLAASGVRSREIAERLGVSVRTVEGHIYRIYEKLDVRSREELAARIRAEDSAGV